MNVDKFIRKFNCAIFPKDCKSNSRNIWMIAGSCPCCIDKPIENLCNSKYAEKYPIAHTLTFGKETVYLCEYHFNILMKDMLEYNSKNKI